MELGLSREPASAREKQKKLIPKPVILHIGPANAPPPQHGTAGSCAPQDRHYAGAISMAHLLDPGTPCRPPPALIAPTTPRSSPRLMEDREERSAAARCGEEWGLPRWMWRWIVCGRVGGGQEEQSSVGGWAC
jgi:hypothetical protein